MVYLVLKLQCAQNITGNLKAQCVRIMASMVASTESCFHNLHPVQRFAYLQIFDVELNLNLC